MPIELTPPNNESGWIQQELYSPSTVRDGAFALQLEAPVLIEGLVYPSDNTSAAVPAEISATRKSRFPGRPAVVFGTTTSTETERDTEGVDYTLWVNSGFEYDLAVVPQTPVDTTTSCSSELCKTAYPTSYINGLSVEDGYRRDLVLDGSDRAIELRGKILDAAGSPFAFPVQVRASTEKGAWSTKGLTCSEQDRETLCACSDNTCLGDFRILLPADAQTINLRINSVPTAGTGTVQTDRGGEKIPTVECFGLSVSELGTMNIDDDATVRVIAEPLRMPPFSLTKPFDISIVGITGVPIAGARVTLRTPTEVQISANTQFEECRARFERVALSNSEGRIEDLDLIPGGETNRLYDVTIITPGTSEFQSLQLLDFEVGAQSGVFAAFKLEKRPIVQGELIDYLGNPVTNAAIVATRLTDEEDAAGLPEISTITTSGLDGAFSLPVDPGTYDIEVTPEQTSGVPSFSVSGQSLKEDREGLTLVAPRPAIVYGKITDAIGEPAATFSVQVFEVAADESTRLRANGITNDEGEIRLVVPDNMSMR